MEKSQEELEQLLDALRQGKLKGHEIYRAVQAFGENNFQVARPEVEALLQSDDFELRFVALKVLTGYWHLAEHWETGILLNTGKQPTRSCCMIQKSSAAFGQPLI